MKLQFTINEKRMPSFEYCDPVSQEFDGNYLNIPQCSLGQATEIYAPHLLDFVPIQMHENMVDYWSKLLSIGGVITLGGTDIYMLSLAVIRRDLPLEHFNLSLFNKPTQLKSLTSLQDTRNLLESKGLEITGCDISEINYVVTAKRNS